MNAPKENAPATYDAAREMLARDLVDALVPPECERHATEYLPIADRLLSLGWCRREAVLREAAELARNFDELPMEEVVTKSNGETIEALEKILNSGDGRKTRLSEDGRLFVSNGNLQRQIAEAILSLLTPQARKEGE